MEQQAQVIRILNNTTARVAGGAAAFVVGILICMYVSRSMKKNNKEMHFSIVQVLGE